MMTLLTNSNRQRRGVLFVLVLVLFSTSEAVALPEFPSTISAHLQMSCDPRCSLCHETDAPTGRPKVLSPFLKSLTANGVVADEESLTGALDQLGSTDTDMDMVGDLDELKNMAGARDPNVAGPGDICASDVKYGCGAQIAEGPVRSARLELWASGAAAALLLVALRRHTRRGLSAR
jgi:hypothetical protein